MTFSIVFAVAVKSKKRESLTNLAVDISRLVLVVSVSFNLKRSNPPAFVFPIPPRL
jgi:hypothetical protein